MRDLVADLGNVRPETKQRVNRHGAMTERELLSLVLNPQQNDAFDVDQANERDLVRHDDIAASKAGADAIRSGEVAFVVLAGGAGTRIGESKAFLRLPKVGITLAAAKLTQASVVTDDGEFLQAPTWFMTSPALSARMVSHLSSLIPTPTGVVFEQFESYRLSVNSRLRFVEQGVPDLYPTGHGDVGLAMLESGVWDDNPGVKHVVIVNCDNVLGSLDLATLSHHLETGAHVTCEVVERRPHDGGSCVAWADGRLQAIENFRLPVDFVEQARYGSTNTMIVSVKALTTPIPWRWHRVRKIIDSRIVVQHERLLQQYTEAFPAQFVLVDAARRYLPIKTESDLARAGELLDGNRLW